jgi:ABC-type ATPase with predicted acetyltransferase domain
MQAIYKCRMCGEILNTNRKPKYIYYIFHQCGQNGAVNIADFIGVREKK